MGLNELADIFDKKTRSKIMSRVKGKNTKPELQVRSLLHRACFRFRLSSKNVPGKPDIVLPKYKVVVLVHGCFWHGHDCYRFSWQKTRKAFWRKKIEGNRERDTRYLQELNEAGWRVCVVWECTLRGKGKLDDSVQKKRLADWLNLDKGSSSIRGRTP